MENFNCIVHKRNREIVWFDEMPVREKRNVYGYIVSTTDKQVIFFSVDNSTDYEDIYYEDLTDEYNFALCERVEKPESKNVFKNSFSNEDD